MKKTIKSNLYNKFVGSIVNYMASIPLPSEVPIPARAFRLYELLLLLKQNEDLAEKCPDGFEFFDKMLSEQGDQETIEMLRDLEDFLESGLDLESKHLDSGANTIFSQVEKKYYSLNTKVFGHNLDFKPIIKPSVKFLDKKIWFVVGVAFLVEALTHTVQRIIHDAGAPELADKMESPTVYFAAFSLVMCAAGILYDQYEKHIEGKILEQIQTISNEAIKRMPKSVLDPQEVAPEKVYIIKYEKPEPFFPR